MNPWASHDYAPGDNESGPWMKCVPGKPIRHKEGCAVGHFDEMECSFDKTRCKFMFRKKTFLTQANGFRISYYRTYEINKKTL